MAEKTQDIIASISLLMYRIRIQRLATLRKSFQSAGYDVTAEQFGLMMHLGTHAGINQKQLGELALKDRPNTMRIVNQLVKRGYVERLPHETDKRAFRLFLTEEGKIVKSHLIRIVIEHHRAAFATLSEKDISNMQRVLKVILANLENMQL